MIQKPSSQLTTICPFVICIDSAEQQPFPFADIKADADKHYATYDVRRKFMCLGRHPDSRGDYSIFGHVGRVGIERKSMADGQTTILGFSDGHRDRFEKELENLAAMEAAAVVFECERWEFFKQTPEFGKKSKSENAKILFRSVLAWEMKYRVPFVFAGGRRQAEIYTFRFFERYWEVKQREQREGKENNGQA